jgi:hypothetical protein
MTSIRTSGRAWPLALVLAVVGLLALPGALQAQQAGVRGPLATPITLRSCEVAALVAAIEQANSTAATDTVVLKKGCTYWLTAGVYGNGSGPNGLPIVTAPLTIHGNGATITRGTAADPFRLLQIQDVDVAVDHVTMSNGSAQHGGAIFTSRSLMITDSTFAYNAASRSGGAIFTWGPLSLTRDSFSQNTAALGTPYDTGLGGGAVWTEGLVFTALDCAFTGNVGNHYGAALALGGNTATIRHSWFALNSKGHLGVVGGGIWLEWGYATVRDSTFTQNVADAGGGIGVEGPGRDLTVTGSTFDRNTANAGGAIWLIMDPDSLATVANSTFADNFGGDISTWPQGGVGPKGAVNVTNSTLARTINGPALNQGTLRNTIVYGGNCGSVVLDGGGNLNFWSLGCPGISADPKLLPLASNGGPTQTMALGSGSVAIDQAVDAICAAPVGSPSFGAGGVDQRGEARPWPKRGHCDIGAYEAR